MQDRVLVFEDPILDCDRVRYVVYCGDGYTQWYKIEDGEHEYLPPIEDNLPKDA